MGSGLMGSRRYHGSAANTCPNTFATSHVTASSAVVGSAAAAVESKKMLKYRNIIAGVYFVPFAIETTGVRGKEAPELVMEIGR